MKTLPSLHYTEFLKRASCYGDVCLPDTSEVMKNFLPAPYFLNLYPTAIYLLDYVRRKYLSIIPAGNDILGYSAKYIIDSGPECFFDLLHPQDLNIINKTIFPANVYSFRENALPACRDMAFTCTYRIRNKGGSYSFVQQRSCYISQAPDGMPLATLGIITNISHFKTDSRIVHIIEDLSKAYSGTTSSITKFYYPDENGAILSRREIDVLKWVCEGLSSKQIADKLHISIHTINNHRKNMLEKTNCKNVSELLNHAVRNGML